MIHRRSHPSPVEGCGPCRWGSVQLGAGTTDTRTEHQPGQRQFMKGFAREFENGDREAYRELRRQGYQPPRIAGSKELATRASTRFEIESGQIMTDQKALTTTMSICSDGGLDPLKPATTPKE